MPLITRQGKGSKLSIQEMDGNLTYLDGTKQFITRTSANSGDIATLSPDGKVGSINSYIAQTGGYVLDILDLPGGDIMYLVYIESKDSPFPGYNIVRINKNTGIVFSEQLFQGDFGDEAIFSGLKLFRDPSSGFIIFSLGFRNTFLINPETGENFTPVLTYDGVGIRMDSIVSKDGKIYFTSLYEQGDVPSQTYVFACEIIEVEGKPGFNVISGVPFEDEFNELVKLTYNQNTDRILATPLVGENLIFGYQSLNTIKSVNFIDEEISLGNAGFDLGTKSVQDISSISIGAKDYAMLYLLEIVEEKLVASFSMVEIGAAQITQVSNTLITDSSLFLPMNLGGVSRTSIVVGDTIITWGLYGNITNEGQEFDVYVLTVKLNSNGSVNTYSLNKLVKYSDADAKDSNFLGTFTSRIAYSQTFGYVYNYFDGVQYSHNLVNLQRSGVTFELLVAESDWKKIIGFYEENATPGSLTNIKLFGIFENPNFDLTPGATYYLGLDAGLSEYFTVFEEYSGNQLSPIYTQTTQDPGAGLEVVVNPGDIAALSTSGWGLRLGKALGADTLLVNIGREFGLDENPQDSYYDSGVSELLTINFNNVNPTPATRYVTPGTIVLITVNGSQLELTYEGNLINVTSSIMSTGWAYSINSGGGVPSLGIVLNEGLTELTVNGNITIYPTIAAPTPK
jgi:hypothetical protein